jgi:hypothetical protein
MEQSGTKGLNSGTVPYRALCTALLRTLRTLDAAWIGPHVQELLGIKTGEEKPAAVPIQVDNQGAIALAKRDGWNRRTRHMNVRY